ncbi:hypothetical protein SLEP1_g25912 [Rubroshorea leprosula]|uniref:Uncharacterized protein n=1 Tax=Rubroshorea leprosula TaxID=152421 RepID=A0AAV5JUV9_9ROSI|nr:hypothetical protein SLEP1_g25912 [Rubroshorea leprosula]
MILCINRRRKRNNFCRHLVDIHIQTLLGCFIRMSI